MYIDTGGPAFPVQELTNRNGDVYQYASEGMTLRDYFAAKAMQGMYANDADNYDFEGVSKAAYLTADAMLKARE